MKSGCCSVAVDIGAEQLEEDGCGSDNEIISKSSFSRASSASVTLNSNKNNPS